MTRLKYERLERGFTQGSLGVLVGITQPTVGLIENGRLIPSPTQLERLGRVLGITPASRLLEDMGPPLSTELTPEVRKEPFTAIPPAPQKEEVTS